MPFVVEENGSTPQGAFPSAIERPDARCSHRSLFRAGVEAKRKASAQTVRKRSQSSIPSFACTAVSLSEALAAGENSMGGSGMADLDSGATDEHLQLEETTKRIAACRDSDSVLAIVMAIASGTRQGRDRRSAHNLPDLE